MASDKMFVYKHRAMLVVILATLFGETLTETCKYTNIHLVGEDGQEQILSFKDPDSGSKPGCDCQHQGNTVQTTCQTQTEVKINLSGKGTKPTVESSTPPKKQLVYSTGPDGLPYPTNRIPETPFQSGARVLDLSPTVTIFIGDIITNICSLRLNSVEEQEMCAGFKKIAECPHEGVGNRELVEQYANFIVENNLMPVPTGDKRADTRIGYGLVLLGANLLDEAIEYFTLLIKEYPNLASAYHGRGMSYSRKGIMSKLITHALEDFTKASNLEPTNPEHYLRTAELYIPLARYTDAMTAVDRALQLDADNSRAFFLKATLQFVAEDLKSAERNYRNSLSFFEVPHAEHTYYNLGLTLYYRGMYRNAIEVFKDLIKKNPKHQEAHASLAHVYGQLGDERNANKLFNTTVHMGGNQLLARQLKGMYHYNNGFMDESLPEFKECLTLDRHNPLCQYMSGLSLTASGHFYPGIKALTKVVVQKPRALKMSPEFIKSHYLREYARYLHHNLEETLLDIDFDGDLPQEFKDNWIRTQPFTFKTPYFEQPGLSPATLDVITPNIKDFPLDVRELLCHARLIGMHAEPQMDGYLVNHREGTATGLAALHIAQIMRDVWNDVGASKTGPGMTWKGLFDVAVKYRRLVNPEEPVFWLDDMPDEQMDTGYAHDMLIVKGHTINGRLMNYFDLVYRLIKTMVSVHCGEGEMYPEAVMHELFDVETYEEMIDVFQKDMFREQGYVMATQVPSMKEPKAPKYEGVYLSVATDKQGKVALGINLPYTRQKAQAITAELDFVFYELYHEVKKMEGRATEDPDHLLQLILSLVYYFLNLSPLSHGTGAVAWSVAIGLIMSVGREITGRIPPGKLLEMEAAISGGPDTFSMVAKKWMNVKRMKRNPLPELPLVSETFPTLRDVMEILNYGDPLCWDIIHIAKTLI